MAEKLPMAKRIATSNTINGAVLGFEKTLFKAADKLRKNIDAAEYLYTLHIKPPISSARCPFAETDEGGNKSERYRQPH